MGHPSVVRRKRIIETIFMYKSIAAACDTNQSVLERFCSVNKCVITQKKTLDSFFKLIFRFHLLLLLLFSFAVLLLLFIIFGLFINFIWKLLFFYIRILFVCLFFAWFRVTRCLIWKTKGKHTSTTIKKQMKIFRKEQARRVGCSVIYVVMSQCVC